MRAGRSKSFLLGNMRFSGGTRGPLREQAAPAWTAGDHVIFAEPVCGEPLGDLKDYGSNAIVLRATYER